MYVQRNKRTKNETGKKNEHAKKCTANKLRNEKMNKRTNKRTKEEQIYIQEKERKWTSTLKHLSVIVIVHPSFGSECIQSKRKICHFEALYKPSRGSMATNWLPFAVENRDKQCYFGANWVKPNCICIFCLKSLPSNIRYTSYKYGLLW